MFGKLQGLWQESQDKRSARHEATTSASAPDSDPVPLTVHVGGAGNLRLVFRVVPLVNSEQTPYRKSKWDRIPVNSGIPLGKILGQWHSTGIPVSSGIPLEFPLEKYWATGIPVSSGITSEQSIL